MKTVSIIATGSEITSGQIINSNAAWISQRLTEFNFEVQKHIAIGDEKDLILKTLKDCSKDSDLVIVTGGLGPTTDDLTRKIVAEWLDHPLALNQNEWDRILRRLQRLEVTPREGHKWQAYFPEDSEIFTNNAGTASGFSIQSLQPDHKCTLWFLPGPPYEIHRIWKDHLEDKLSKLGPQKKTQLLSWCFLDLPESEVANFVEDTFQESFSIGYRASPPIVELKIWVPDGFDISSDDRFAKLEAHFCNELHYKDKNDPTTLFLKSFLNTVQSETFYIKDEVTQGDLLFRLKSVKDELENIKTPQIFYSNTDFKESQRPYLHVFQTSDSDYEFTFQTETLNFRDTFSIKKKVSTLRKNNWVCEKIFKSLCAQLKL